ncbi:MAG TPA: hypothetical protein VLA49_20445, partial [Anaerolineales bacterium]|nr:hypothetical protein [Anaerolineales bacterium]
AHFFHNQISTLLVLPSSASFVENINNLLNTQDYWKRPEKVFDRLFSAKSYVDSLPYWQERFDRFSTQSFLPMWVNLLLIVLGISTAWRRHRLAGVFPLFAFNGYLLVLSFFRISGWRFIMPVDWVGYLYFSIGLIQVITWVYNYFMNRQSEEPLWEVGGFPHQGKWFSRKSWIFIGLSFFFLSASIPLFEIIIPQKYAPESLDLLLQETRDQLIANNIEFDLENFLNQENSGVHLGLALYPRFDLAGKGHFDSQWESHLNRDFSRLGFLLQTSHDGLFHVVLPVERLPDSFPNGSDVIILACKKENFLLANMVKIMTGSDHKIFYSSAPEWDCT